MGAANIAYLEAKAALTAREDDERRLGAAIAAMAGGPGAVTAPVNSSENKPRTTKKDKELPKDNPLAHIRCAGCGERGTMALADKQPPDGAGVRLLVCTHCGNQAITG